MESKYKHAHINNILSQLLQTPPDHHQQEPTHHQHMYQRKQQPGQDGSTRFVTTPGTFVSNTPMATKYSIPVTPVVVKTLVECEAATAKMLKQADARRVETGRSCTILGLDTEWDEDGKVALIQLATIDACVIIQVHMFAGTLRPKQKPATTCASLRKLLWRQDIIKVGSAIATDLLMLSTELGLPSRSFVDLQTIVRWALQTIVRWAGRDMVLFELKIRLHAYQGLACKTDGAYMELDCEASAIHFW